MVQIRIWTRISSQVPHSLSYLAPAFKPCSLSVTFFSLKDHPRLFTPVGVNLSVPGGWSCHSTKCYRMRENNDGLIDGFIPGAWVSIAPAYRFKGYGFESRSGLSFSYFSYPVIVSIAYHTPAYWRAIYQHIKLYTRIGRTPVCLCMIIDMQ